LLEGKSNKIICRELDLAESTVKNHVTLILKALNVTSRTQAVIAAARMGLVFERAALPDKASLPTKNSSDGRLLTRLPVAPAWTFRQ
jgi:hypothetical protein